jgi:hypothetical protein
MAEERLPPTEESTIGYANDLMDRLEAEGKLEGTTDGAPRKPFDRYYSEVIPDAQARTGVTPADQETYKATEGAGVVPANTLTPESNTLFGDLQVDKILVVIITPTRQHNLNPAYALGNILHRLGWFGDTKRQSPGKPTETIGERMVHKHRKIWAARRLAKLTNTSKSKQTTDDTELRDGHE